MKYKTLGKSGLKSITTPSPNVLVASLQTITNT